MRLTIFDVHQSEAVVRGRVLAEEQHQAALNALPAQPASDEVKVLLTDDAPWALVKRSVSDVRRVPDGLSEQLTQLLVGESVRVLEDRGYWSLVRAERDGYIGWTRSAALQPLERKMVRAYQKSATVIIKAPLAQAYNRAAKNAVEVGKIPFGVTLPMIETRGSLSAVRLPDDTIWWLRTIDLLPLADRPKANAEGMAFTLDLIKHFVGTPYMWGGRSPYGYDCSGLAQTFWAFMGVQIPRDADQQFHAGKVVKGQPRLGDLLFFGGDDSDLADARTERITHVVISLGGDEVIHANGGSWNIAYNSLDPASPIYRADLRDSLVGVRRF
jgi:hypothetical protein